MGRQKASHEAENLCARRHPTEGQICEILVILDKKLSSAQVEVDSTVFAILSILC